MIFAGIKTAGLQLTLTAPHLQVRLRTFINMPCSLLAYLLVVVDLIESPSISEGLLHISKRTSICWVQSCHILFVSLTYIIITSPARR